MFLQHYTLIQDIVLSPAKTDIKKLFSKMVKNTVESTKSFHR